MTFNQIIESWRSRRITTEADIDTAIAEYRVLFAYHSNTIEGAGVDLHQTREIFENGRVIDYTGDLRSLFEAQNQKVCYDWLLPKLAAKEELTSDIILGVHERLLHGCFDEHRWEEGERPGEWKKHLYGVGLSAGLEPADVPEEMDYIVSQAMAMTDETPEKVLTTAAWLHCNFEYIHPFADGNGRAGRTVMNYYLMLRDMPPVIIFEEDRKLYYEALAVFDASEKVDGMTAFLKDEMVKTWSAERRSPATGKKKRMLLL
ncbi:MAG: Fic family protein [Lachnospiraceae bacterium]|nr:Fic family protein [Lachnospiraceae bacterium]